MKEQELLPAKDPVVEAVQRSTATPMPNLEQITSQLIAQSQHEYGGLTLELDELQKQVNAKEKRREEVRQHIAALQTALNMSRKRAE